MKKQKKGMKKRPTALKHLEKRIAIILAGGHETQPALAALEATHVKWYHDAYGNVMKRMEKANEV